MADKDPTKESQSAIDPFAKSNKRICDEQLRIKEERDELLGALKNMSGWARIFIKQLQQIDGKPRGGISYHEEHEEACAIIAKVEKPNG